MMTENKKVFEDMPVSKALATLAVPTIISQLIAMIYNMADTFYIGSTRDPYKVAAVSLVFVLQFVLSALSNLFGVGGGSLISRLLGQKQPEKAKEVSAFCFYGSLLVAALFSLFCLLRMEPLLLLMGASGNTLGYASDYVLWVVVIGGVPTTLSMTLSHLLRSEGYAKQASLGLSIGGVLNIILDPLFMFVLLPPGNEVKGAAQATMLSNLITLCYLSFAFYRLRDKTVLSLSIKHVLPEKQYIRSIFMVGLPSALSTMLSCLASSTANRLTSSFGDIPVAAVGVVKKIDMLPMNVAMGLCQGMMPLVAYNYAAGNYQRMRAFSHAARRTGIVFALLCILLYQLFAKDLVRFFINDEETIALGAQFIRIICLSIPFIIANFHISFTLQAMGKGPQALLLSTCRQGLIYIPLLFIMKALFGLYGIICAQLIAESITTLISIIFYQKLYRRLIVEQTDSPEKTA